MNKEQIKHLLERHIPEDGFIESGVKGVRLFKVTDPMRCAPAVYEPTVVAILSGSKEAILDGHRYVYDNSRYLCCSMSMPVEAGTPEASKENPLIGVFISLETQVVTELAIAMENASGAIRQPRNGSLPQGLALARWDAGFTDALSRLLLLLDNPSDMTVLGQGRLRELYYAVLKGDAGDSAMRSFGVGNEIARAIEYLSNSLDETVTIEQLAEKVGMSRAVFHRKFKQATTMSPIQFVKSMRLNNAAMRIAGGLSVNEAAMEVGYASTSQFSREFKRLYGHSPKQWTQTMQFPAALM